MWSAIFSQPEIKRHPDLQKYLREQLDYEVAYNEVMDSDDFTIQTKDDFTTAIERAYQQIHDGFYGPQDLINSAVGVCKMLLGSFGGSGANERGFIFTLNQDLFVERFFLNGSHSLFDLAIPGIGKYGYFNFQLPKILTEDYRVYLPGQEKVLKLESEFWSKIHGRFSYLKLHGSYWWRCADGSNAMAIGSNKTGLIDREPYLKWSHSVFKQVLKGPDCRLVVVGYGFGDEHINKVIAESILHHRLRLHVVCPDTHREFQNRLMPLQGTLDKQPPKHGPTLWKGLDGYYPTKVIGLYSYSGGSSALTPLGEGLFRNTGI